MPDMRTKFTNIIEEYMEIIELDLVEDWSVFIGGMIDKLTELQRTAEIERNA